MFCEAYNQSLKNAAASGEVLSPAERKHLALCAPCRDAFAEEQYLFAAIDSSLRAESNCETPATLIPRVRVALNNEHVSDSRRFGMPVWGFAGATIAAAVIFGLLHSPSKHPSKPAEPADAISVAAAKASPTISPVNPAPSGGVSPVQHEKPVVLVASRGSKSEFPEVLVPEEERAAFAQFMANASPTSGTVSAKAALLPRAPESSVQISPVEIANLEVRPLDQKEGRQGQF